MTKPTFTYCPDCHLYTCVEDGHLFTLKGLIHNYGTTGWEQTEDQSCGCIDVELDDDWLMDDVADVFDEYYNEGEQIRNRSI